MEDILEVSAPREITIFLPCGLLGLEHIKRFILLTDPDEEPFSWLQVMDQSDLAFIVIPGFVAFPDYSPDIPAEDVAFLDLYRPEDALVFNIVTLHSNGTATVNLKGPVVVNRFTMRGKQVILANAAELSVQQPLPILS